jgi:hypothetical protein
VNRSTTSGLNVFWWDCASLVTPYQILKRHRELKKWVISRILGSFGLKLGCFFCLELLHRCWLCWRRLASKLCYFFCWLFGRFVAYTTLCFMLFNITLIRRISFQGWCRLCGMFCVKAAKNTKGDFCVLVGLRCACHTLLTNRGLL